MNLTFEYHLSKVNKNYIYYNAFKGCTSAEWFKIYKIYQNDHCFWIWCQKMIIWQIFDQINYAVISFWKKNLPKSWMFTFYIWVLWSNVLEIVALMAYTEISTESGYWLGLRTIAVLFDMRTELLSEAIGLFKQIAVVQGSSL